jgi:hypothetical protein
VDAQPLFHTRTGPVRSYNISGKVYAWSSGARTQPDLGTLSAIYRGLYNTTELRKQATGFTCLSDNCTWQLVPSIAVCNSCIDVSKHIQRKTGYGVRENGTSEPLPSNVWKNGTFTSFRLPYAYLTNYDTSPR